MTRLPRFNPLLLILVEPLAARWLLASQGSRTLWVATLLIAVPLFGFSLAPVGRSTTPKRLAAATAYTVALELPFLAVAYILTALTSQSDIVRVSLAYGALAICLLCAFFLIVLACAAILGKDCTST